MAAGKKKYYVVWAGRIPGIYDDWRDAKEQIDNYPNPRYKGFTSAAEAAEAFRKGRPAFPSEGRATGLYDHSGGGPERLGG